MSAEVRDLWKQVKELQDLVERLQGSLKSLPSWKRPVEIARIKKQYPDLVVFLTQLASEFMK